MCVSGAVKGAMIYCDMIIDQLVATTEQIEAWIIEIYWGIKWFIIDFNLSIDLAKQQRAGRGNSIRKNNNRCVFLFSLCHVRRWRRQRKSTFNSLWFNWIVLSYLPRHRNRNCVLDEKKYRERKWDSIGLFFLSLSNVKKNGSRWQTKWIKAFPSTVIRRPIFFFLERKKERTN